MSTSLLDIASRFGYLAVFVGVGAEGVGIPLPGETVLVIAAVLAASGHLNLLGVGITAWASASVCPQLGYVVGRTWGARLLKVAWVSRLYRPAHLARAEAFYDRFGWLAVLLGRFIAVLRIFAAPLAGMHRMPWLRYSVANTVGAAIWVAFICIVGAVLGKNLARAERLVADAGFIGLVVVLLLIAAAVIVYWRYRRRGRDVAAASRTEHGADR